MTPVIDPNFSVFGLVQRVQSSGMLLNHRRTMSMVSYEIENATRIDGARTRLFSGFQYMSKFIPQISRYTEIALKAESVYVFGVQDVSLPVLPNIHYVPLQPSDQLAKEWFLVSYGREYFSALATEELSRFHDPDEQRIFKGVWTFEHGMVQILHEWLSSAVDVQAMSITDTDLNLARQMKLISATLERFSERLLKRYQKSVIASEGQTVIQTALQPALAGTEKS
jgi:DICT domain-containing protein